MQIVPMKFGELCGPKDYAEKIGDACLHFGRRAFGYTSCDGTVTTEKISRSTKMLFLFILTLPVSVLISVIGLGCEKISTTYDRKIKAFTGSVEQDKKLAIWNRTFAQAAHDRKNLSEHRVALYKETKDLCRQGFYFHHGRKVELDQAKTKHMVEASTIYACDEPLPDTLKNPQHTTQFEVVEEDTFDLCEKYQKQGYRVVGLNMANAVQPGGGVEHGCGAQEESLFRRSNYFQALYPAKEKGMYPIAELSVLYTPDVQVFRTRETYFLDPVEKQKIGYEFREPFAVDMIACAFYDLSHNEEEPPEFESNTKMRIRSILRAAYLTGHDSVVLGACGCGAFANDPRKVSRLFREVLEEVEFKGRFKKVGFGIIYPEISYRDQAKKTNISLNLLTIFRDEMAKIAS